MLKELYSVSVSGDRKIPGVTVVMATGPSTMAGIGAGDIEQGRAPFTLSSHPNVYIWQADTYNTLAASWEKVDHTAATIGAQTTRVTGYLKGQVATKYLTLANKIAEVTGDIVLLIVTTMNGMPSDVWNPDNGDIDSSNPVTGEVTNNNMWYWTATAVNQALAAARAGTGLPSAYNVTKIDIGYLDIATGNALYCSAFPLVFLQPQRKLNEATDTYVADTIAFIEAAEGKLASAIGGWAEYQHTQWYIQDVYKTNNLLANIATFFNAFDGVARLINSCNSLVWQVPSVYCKTAASNSEFGLSDALHYNAITQIENGKYAAALWLTQSVKPAKSINVTNYPALYNKVRLTTTDTTPALAINYTPDDGARDIIELIILGNRTGATPGTYFARISLTYSKVAGAVVNSEGATVANVIAITPSIKKTTGTGNTLAVQFYDASGAASIMVVGNAAQTWDWIVECSRTSLN